MDKCCATCKWCEDVFCANEDSEWCGDQVGEDWSCDEWKMNGDVPYSAEEKE